jgi:hypothetical protein
MIIFTNSCETLHWILLFYVCQSHLVIVFYLNDLIFLPASIPAHPPKSVLLLHIGDNKAPALLPSPPTQKKKIGLSWAYMWSLLIDHMKIMIQNLFVTHFKSCETIVVPWPFQHMSIEYLINFEIFIPTNGIFLNIHNIFWFGRNNFWKFQHFWK